MSPDSMARAEVVLARIGGSDRTIVEYCRSVHEVISSVVPADRWCAFALDPPTLLPTNGYHDEGVDMQLVPRLLELELGAHDYNHFPALARSRAGVATLSGATAGDPTSSARWRDVIEPSGLTHELRAVFREGSQAWGALTLLRGPDARDFMSDDESFIGRIAPIVANGFRRIAARQQLAHGEDVRDAGLIIVSTDPMEVQTMTNAAAAWLEQLDDGGYGSNLPGAVMSAIYACRSDPTKVATVRARTRAGRWLTLTADTTPDRQGTIGLIVSPSRPYEIASIVGAAHGLTERETDVVMLVASGHGNKQIARILGLSPYTVGDHLKSLYAKLDVATRSEMTSKLFYDHYLPRELAHQQIGADGWFLSTKPT